MSAKKVIIILAVLLVIAGIAGATIYRSQQNVVKVTTATVARQDLVAIVSGTGQIKPKTYVNIGATAFGRITHLEVKEGDRVRKGRFSLRLKTSSRNRSSPPSKQPSSRPEPTLPPM
jgi:HlyD family secretion protein